MNPFKIITKLYWKFIASPEKICKTYWSQYWENQSYREKSLE